MATTFEERFDDVVINGRVVTALFKSKDVTEVNLLKRSIMSEIETYSINYVVFNVNTTARHPEILALRLGQCVIDHTRFVPPQEGNFKTTINVKGPKSFLEEPKEFSTDDIVDIPFKYSTPIATLKAKQELLCDLIVTKSIGREHVKWRPISSFTFEEEPEGFRIKFIDIGMMDPREILRQGLEKMKVAATREGHNIFNRV
jgi:DNA-directed RNA polymerase alpha subunit